MSKKTWIIGGVAVLAIAGATMQTTAKAQQDRTR